MSVAERSEQVVNAMNVLVEPEGIVLNVAQRSEWVEPEGIVLNGVAGRPWSESVSESNERE